VDRRLGVSGFASKGAQRLLCLAGRLGLTDTKAISAIADGAKWHWSQLERHLPSCQGVLDVWHASQHLWEAAKAALPEAEVAGRVEARRQTLLRGGAGGPGGGPGGRAVGRRRGRTSNRTPGGWRRAGRSAAG
jgi:hypothetical protein